MFSLEGRNALVTGASRGIGRALALALARAGAGVVCASSREGGTTGIAAEIRALGRTTWEADADLADGDAVLALADRVLEQAGTIDILVNNAGTITRHPAVEYPRDEWDRVLRTNLDSAFLLSQRLGAEMVRRRSGKIINVASVLAFTGGVTVPAYTASKHAIVGLTKALANEWAAHNVQVNAIAPGYIATDNTAALRADTGRSRDIGARIPAGRWGEPDDLAGATVFLASSASDYVSGHVLVVDGGWSAR